MKPIVLLMGPTATGKTAQSLQLAKAFNGEIISADSTLVYRGMDIGTAKPTPAEQQKVPHHLIDIYEPHETYSTGQFCADALNAIDEIHAREKLPFLVGGTMLYFHYLEQGYLGMPESNPDIRASIEAEAKKVGWPAMWENLKLINPERATKIHPNDKIRISRALEIHQIKQSNPTQQDEPKLSEKFQVIPLCLYASDRKALHQRIELRFHQMIKQGLIAEVETLLSNPLNQPDFPAFKTVGYRQVCQFLNSELKQDEMTERAIIATRQLCKRQHTWLNKWPETAKYDTFDPNLTTALTSAITEKLEGETHDN